MQTSYDGRALIEHFEGLRLVAYRDVAGVWTIGYGHTGNVKPGQRISEAQADALLATDLKASEAAIAKYVRVPLAQHEYDALVSLIFNIGVGGFAGSTVRRRLNAGDRRGAAAAFLMWVHADGHVLEDLVKRRRAEAALFTGSHSAAITQAAQAAA